MRQYHEGHGMNRARVSVGAFCTNPNWFSKQDKISRLEASGWHVFGELSLEFACIEYSMSILMTLFYIEFQSEFVSTIIQNID